MMKRLVVLSISGALSFYAGTQHRIYENQQTVSQETPPQADGQSPPEDRSWSKGRIGATQTADGKKELLERINAIGPEDYDKASQLETWLNFYSKDVTDAAIDALARMGRTDKLSELITNRTIEPGSMRKAKHAAERLRKIDPSAFSKAMMEREMTKLRRGDGYSKLPDWEGGVLTKQWIDTGDEQLLRYMIDASDIKGITIFAARNHGMPFMARYRNRVAEILEDQFRYSNGNLFNCEGISQDAVRYAHALRMVHPEYASALAQTARVKCEYEWLYAGMTGNDNAAIPWILNGNKPDSLKIKRAIASLYEN